MVWCVSWLQDRAIREGLTFVAPYDDPHTIAGQGTIGDEILRQVMAAPGVLTAQVQCWRLQGHDPQPVQHLLITSVHCSCLSPCLSPTITAAVCCGCADC